MGHSRDAHVDFATTHAEADSAILWQTVLSNIEIGEDFKARNHGRMQMHRVRLDILKNTVDAISQPGAGSTDGYVDIGGFLFDGILNCRVDKMNGRRIGGEVLKARYIAGHDVFMRRRRLERSDLP